MQDFKFAGKWLSDFGAIVTSQTKFEIAQLDGSLVSIPGKSGDTYISNKRYSNVEFSRSIGFTNKRDITQNETLQKIINWLAYSTGYQEFEDTQHNGLVTYAVLTNFNEIIKNLQRIHTATLQFNRVPFWYSRSGLEPITYTDSSSLTEEIVLYNTFPINSEPIIRLYFNTEDTSIDSVAVSLNINGVVVVNNNLSFKGNRNILEINVEKERVAIINSKTSLVSELVTLNSLEGFVIGENKIKLNTLPEQLTKVEIIPRWRCL